MNVLSDKLEKEMRWNGESSTGSKVRDSDLLGISGSV